MFSNSTVINFYLSPYESNKSSQSSHVSKLKSNVAILLKGLKVSQSKWHPGRQLKGVNPKPDNTPERTKRSFFSRFLWACP